MEMVVVLTVTFFIGAFLIFPYFHVLNRGGWELCSPADRL